MADAPELNDWDETFPDGFSMILAGTRRGGKSTAIQHFYLEHWRKSHDSTVVFTSKANATFYNKLLHDKGTVIVGYDERKLWQIINFMEAQEGRTLLLIFDDSIGREQKNSDAILQIFTRGRHMGISMVFATQTIMQTNADWRRNVDIFMMLRLKMATSKEWVTDNYLQGTMDPEEHGFTKDKDLWRTTIKKYTEERKFGSLVVDFGKEQDNILFKFISPPPPDLFVFTKMTDEEIQAWLEERGYMGFFDLPNVRSSKDKVYMFLDTPPEQVEILFSAEDEGVRIAYLK